MSLNDGLTSYQQESVLLFYQITMHQNTKKPVVDKWETAMNVILTAQEVARYLKLSKSTVYRLVQAKKLPAFKVGGKWRFHEQALVAWLVEESHKNQSDV